MIEIKNKKNCTGCGACQNVCPKHAIKWQEDIEGFLYPVVDDEKCINCHLCEKVCPMIASHQENTTADIFPLFFAGQLKNKLDLTEVSSGGAFWGFVQYTLSKGGVVYGAIQKDVDIVTHIRADDLNTAMLMRRSKYFQSNTSFTFRQVKDDLNSDRMVLFSGTGCQIAGLKGYLGKNYNNLFTCEVVCHGVPSRKVWNSYRKEKEEREGKIIKDLVFRDKSAGWNKNQYKITYIDGSIEKEASTKQLFHAGYLRGLFYRPSCGCCRFASLPRVADVTLADYWKYQGRFHSANFNLGVSLISVNTNKGKDLLQKSSDYLEYDYTEKSLALSSCKHLNEHPSENPNREAFFNFFLKKGYYAAANKYIIIPKENAFKTHFKNIIKRIINVFFQIN